MGTAMDYVIIDTNSLYELQKLYDLFIGEKVDGKKVFWKKMPARFLPLQKNRKYRKIVLGLYNEVFQAYQPEQLQAIIVRSNMLINELIQKYGDFRDEDEFNRIDTLDKLGLTDIADSLRNNAKLTQGL
jgi:hypothetical protein